MKKHIHCPANAWDCPYYTDEGHPCRCTLEDPMEDCDDFAFFWDEEELVVDKWEKEWRPAFEKIMMEV